MWVRVFVLWQSYCTSLFTFFVSHMCCWRSWIFFKKFIILFNSCFFECVCLVVINIFLTSHEVISFCMWCYCEICFIMLRPRFFWAACFAFLLSIVVYISFNDNLLFIILRFRSQILITLNPYLILCLGSVWSNGLFTSNSTNVILFSLD